VADDAAKRSRLPQVVLMCGIAGAGKTTYAKQLEEQQGYVRLSIDEEIWRRFGRYGVDYDQSKYERFSDEAEVTLRQRLVELIGAGSDVVVDYSLWSRATRDEYKAVVELAGGSWQLVYLKATPEQLRERLVARRSRFDADAAFPISDGLLEHFLTAFQEPNGEGETVLDLGD
jgi:predicted kinase